MKTPLIATLAMLLLAACSASSDEESAGDPVALVTLATVQRAPVSETVTLYGTVEGGKNTRDVIFAPIEARVVGISSAPGDTVAKGQPIMTLAPGPDMAVTIAKAKSDAAAADAAYARAVRLKKDGLAGDADVEAAKAAKESADALAASLTKRQGELNLRAPSAGYLDSIPVSPGDLVSAGTTLATILHRQGTMRLHFGAPPDVAKRLSLGDMVPLRTGAAARGKATITTVSPQADPATGMVAVYASPPDTQALTPGEGVAGEFSVTSSAEALVAPYAAILDDAGQPFVFVVSDGVAHRHDVVTGATDGKTIAILKGVAAGDKLVVEGGTAVEDGMKVRLK